MIKKLLLFCLICVKIQAQNLPDSQIYLADPAIFHSGNTYYLYGTVEGNSGDGFKVYVSKDQKNWEDKGYALKKGESFGEKGFWAPQVFAYQNNFYIAYVANEMIAIAKSDSPLGPFRQDTIKPLEAPVKQIDPYIFQDDDGKIYMYHVRLKEGNRLFVAEMKKDLSAILPETVKECINASELWENTAAAKWPVAEGPTVLKHKGLYYLFYTANDFRNPDYAVGYATSKSPLGPWEKYKGNPILSRKDIGVNGPGHGDFYSDGSGDLNYVFHTHFSENKVSKRKTAVLKASFHTDTTGTDKLVPDFKSFRFLHIKE
jgi:xylan 1,4-beta-xylosidase